MQDNTMETQVVTPATDEGKTSEPSHRTERTEAEKAAYNLRKNAERAKELGVDVNDILGSDDQIPAWYKAEKAKEAQQTSIQLAEAISDDDTREKVKDYLRNRLVPSGNPEEDFKLALGAASASKNKQVLEEIGRYTAPRKIASGGSQPANLEEPFVPTAEEVVMMSKPYNLSKEKVLAARASHEAKN